MQDETTYEGVGSCHHKKDQRRELMGEQDTATRSG